MFSREEWTSKTEKKRDFREENKQDEGRREEKSYNGIEMKRMLIRPKKAQRRKIIERNKNQEKKG